MEKLEQLMLDGKKHGAVKELVEAKRGIKLMIEIYEKELKSDILILNNSESYENSDKTDEDKNSEDKKTQVIREKIKNRIEKTKITIERLKLILLRYK